MVIIETPTFSRQIVKILTDEEYLKLQLELIDRPSVGNIIPGSAGLRKHRFGAKGRGRRGGARIIYYWVVEDEQILMLFAFPKNERTDLTKAEYAALGLLVKSHLNEA